ncbi:ABC transporter ATP-binding protein [Kribbella monticola]|uniref:ABC transporter ATP-binding protein n=1 Tax=Kribbella monticola TaxID=2185285 RepID=UPI000DD4E219|nr:ATP-binding cassette domain-containing protein [Kribbella monticola]
MKPLVEVRGLSAVAGTAVLVDGVDFKVWPGQVTALVGASGSGKTTSALALLGEHGRGVRLSGEVRVDGIDLMSNGADAAAVRGRVVAYMPQHPGSALNPARRIGTAIGELSRLHNHGADGVVEALRAAQLPGDRSTQRRFPHQFSGGQRQRIALAQALACRPKVLVLDEPSTGLDSITRLQLVSELKELTGQGLGILLLSHDLELVRALAQYVVVLDAGRVIDAGGTDVLPAATKLRPRPGTTGTPTPLLQAMNLTASLRARGRDPILQEVELTVPPGGCVGVVGRSGSGKTTLARCLAGLHERHTGRITLSDQPLPVLRKRSAEQARRVQYVWQEVRGSFDERRRVDDQVARTAERLRGVSRVDAKAEAVATLARLGVSAMVAARPPSQLSGGELQRAAIARALLARPDVLICDEITTALDEHGTALVVELLTELQDSGMALVWISHDLGLVAAVADRVLVLEVGRVVEEGPPATVMAKPAHEITERLVRAARLGRSGVAASDPDPGPRTPAVPEDVVPEGAVPEGAVPETVVPEAEPPPVLTSCADTRSEPQR